MTVFESVKKLCDERKISINELEKSLGYSKNTLYRLKTQNPGSDKLQSIADYFKVSTDYLLGRTAFKNPTELFEHWSGHNHPYFESAFDFGGLLKEVREDQGVSQQEVSKALCVTESDVDNMENGSLPLNYEWAEKYANFLDTSVKQIFINNGMDDSLNNIPQELLHLYQEQGMSVKEMSTAYTEFKAAEYKDAISEPPLYEGDQISAKQDFKDDIEPKDIPDWATSKDLRDFKKMLEDDAPVMFDGVPIEGDARQRVMDVLTGLFWQAKEMNKKTYGRKKDNKKNTSDKDNDE